VLQPTYGALPERFAYPVVHSPAGRPPQTHCHFPMDLTAGLRSFRCSLFARAML
jgi:hypothetical protein